MKFELIKLKTVATEREGTLSFFESKKDIGFEICRFYYIYGASIGVERGRHAHKNLSQLLICPYGSITIKLDDGNEKKEVILNQPDIALYLSPGIWREMIWNKDNSILCVAASDYYNEEDYIRDYSEFIRYIQNNSKG